MQKILFYAEDFVGILFLFGLIRSKFLHALTWNTLLLLTSERTESFSTTEGPNS